MKFNLIHLLKSVKFLLLVIIIIAGFLRFYQLGQIPSSPDWDEASLGYNSYSILQTGKDEYGTTLPVMLKSYGDYKPALYMYLDVIPVQIFGLNTFAVRFPAALTGTLAILMFYLLLKEIFGSKDNHKYIILLAAFLLAISPWHIQFSRVAFESNLGVFLNIVWVLFFLRSLKNPKYLILSVFFAGLNIYTYQAEKVFTPLLFLTLLIIFYKDIFKIRLRYLIISIIVGIITLIPFVILSFNTPEIWQRAQSTSIASDQTSFLANTVTRLTRDKTNNYNLGLLLDNRRVTYIFAAANGYLAHFDLNWLFIKGDEARHHAPGMGLLYLIELPFLLWGIYSLIFSNLDKKYKLVIFAWFLIAPIPASITSGVPHAVRTMRFLPMVQIFVAYGLFAFINWLREKTQLIKHVLIFLLLIFSLNFIYYLNQYFVQQNYYYSSSWQYGYEQAINEINIISDNYDQIIVSSEPELDKSYMFFLFYLKVNPGYYQKLNNTNIADSTGEVDSFLNYHFRPINWDQEEKNPKILYVGRPNDFPENIKILKTINFLNNKPAILIVEG